MKAVAALLGVLFTCEAISAYGYGGYGYGGGLGYGGLGYGGYGVGVGVAEVVEPVIPVAGGLVNAVSYVDSYLPGSSYCGYGTYGPAYGGGPYPLGAYGGLGGYGYGGFGGGYGGYGPLVGGLGYGGLGYGGLGYGGIGIY